MRVSRPVLVGAAALGALLGSAGIAGAAGTSEDVAARAALEAEGIPGVEATATDVGSNSFRLSGGNRYETSVAVSQAVWGPESTSIVFLATGEGYADALSMGASTVEAGPVLLTRPTSLPAVVEAELARLRPCLVIVVGGEAAVSREVAEKADSYTDPTGCAPA